MAQHPKNRNAYVDIWKYVLECVGFHCFVRDLMLPCVKILFFLILIQSIVTAVMSKHCDKNDSQCASTNKKSETRNERPKSAADNDDVLK